MDSSFVRGFVKTAFVGALAGTAIKALGKGIVRAGGGPINTALTGLGAVQDYSKGMDKMKRAATR